jgi:hypothetical protein
MKEEIQGHLFSAFTHMSSGHKEKELNKFK